LTTLEKPIDTGILANIIEKFSNFGLEYDENCQNTNIQQVSEHEMDCGEAKRIHQNINQKDDDESHKGRHSKATSDPPVYGEQSEGNDQGFNDVLDPKLKEFERG
jgi:hypothetical protein